MSINICDEYSISMFKKREVYSPSDKLKKIQRFINTSILDYADYNREVVYSYIKGKSARDAVEVHSKNQYFFQTDIYNFFGSISANNVKNSLARQLANVPISDINNYVDFLFNLLVIDDKLPIGFSTSPMLSNICLRDFDYALNEFCRRKKYTYTRYSDDILISSNSQFCIDELSKHIQTLLFENVNKYITLNKAKTKVHTKGERFKILGYNILINNEITISSKDKKEAEILLHFYLNDLDKFDNYVVNNIAPRFNQSGEKSIREIGTSSLSGRLIGINAMDKKYLTKLRRKYGNTLIDMFLRKTV
ncbi:reverse transcriptase family protein [Vibrio sp. TRT 2004]|uniref:reverse transcriptase family protein n=1 Tax=Vibrio sp. TRT 2004 TaxID=3418506 RepID=UPI003CED25C4